MPRQRRVTVVPPLSREARSTISRLLAADCYPPDNSPVPTEHIDLLLLLRRKERERRRPD